MNNVITNVYNKIVKIIKSTYMPFEISLNLSMKKILMSILLLVCSIIMLVGCKNEDDLLKEGKYQEAYDMCKDQDKKDEILRENKYAVIIKNCKEISELDDTTDITFIADLGHLKKGKDRYVFCVKTKKTLGDGYYQDHYYYFRADGANTGDAFYSDIKKWIHQIIMMIYQAMFLQLTMPWELIIR